MGLLVDVYRTKGRDCTNGGISSGFDTLCLVNVPGPFDPSDSAPAAMLVKGYAAGTVRVVPADIGDCRTTFGGNFAATSDSRFGEAVRNLIGGEFYGAVAIHDRFEG